MAGAPPSRKKLMSRCVTSQDPIEPGKVGGSHTAGLEDDGVDGKCEECGPQWVALLDAASAVDGAVADDERGGRPVAEVCPRSDLGEGLPDRLAGRPNDRRSSRHS